MSPKDADWLQLKTLIFLKMKTIIFVAMDEESHNKMYNVFIFELFNASLNTYFTFCKLEIFLSLIIKFYHSKLWINCKKLCPPQYNEVNIKKLNLLRHCTSRNALPVLEICK